MTSLRLVLLSQLFFCSALADERPNFVFFLTDDISCDDIVTRVSGGRGPSGSEDRVELLRDRPADRRFFASAFAGRPRRSTHRRHRPHPDLPGRDRAVSRRRSRPRA